jgi:hypothetical protein
VAAAAQRPSGGIEVGSVLVQWPVGSDTMPCMLATRTMPCNHVLSSRVRSLVCCKA